MSASGIGKKPAPPKPTTTPNSNDEEIDNNELKRELDGVKALVQSLFGNLDERFATMANAAKVGEAFTDLAAKINAIKGGDKLAKHHRTSYGSHLKVAKPPKFDGTKREEL